MEQIKNQRLRIISVGENIVQNFLQDSLACFSQNKNEKSIPYWWLYDEIGSQIFEGYFIKANSFNFLYLFVRNNQSPRILPRQMRTVNIKKIFFEIYSGIGS